MAAGSVAKFISSLAALGALGASLGGCIGVPGVPESQIGDSHQLKKELFYAVVRGVQCEIRQAVAREINGEKGERIDWLRYWSAQMNLKFTIDFGGGFNPGATFLTPIVSASTWLGDGSKIVSSQSYNLGIGGGVNGDALRVESVSYFVPFANMRFDDRRDWIEPRQPCYHAGGFTIAGDLALYEWLDDVIEPFKYCAFSGISGVPPSIFSTGDQDEKLDMCPVNAKAVAALNTIGKSEGDNPITAFTHEIQFKVTLSGSITPTWKLVRINSPAPNSSLFSAQQVFTSDLTVVLGPPDRVYAGASAAAKKPARPVARAAYVPSDLMKSQFNAALVGSAVRQGQ